MSRPDVVVVSSDEEAAPGGHEAGVRPHRQGRWRFSQWAPRRGHGLCRGIDGPCTLGDDDQPAGAGVEGLCDLCNLSDMPFLHRHGQGRLTHLLLHLAPEKAELVLRRLEAAEGEDLAAEVRHRLQRARHRNRADRPRRGPRGPYKRRRRTLAAAGTDPPMPAEYGQDSDHEAKDDEAANEPYDTNNSSESDEDEGGHMEDELREPAKDVHGSEDEDESAEDPGDTRDDQKSDNDEAEPTDELGEAKKDRHEADDEPSAESSRKPRRRSALRPSRFPPPSKLQGAENKRVIRL